MLFGPIAGPLRQHNKCREQEFKPQQTTLSGYVSIENVDGMSFAEQLHTFESFGYAVDPSNDHHHGDGHKFVGDAESMKSHKAMTIFNQSNEAMKQSKKSRRKRLRNEDPSDINGYLGPWAPTHRTKEEEEKYAAELKQRAAEWEVTQSLKSKKKRKLNGNDDDKNGDKEGDGEGSEEESAESIAERRRREREESAAMEHTEFHGADSELVDYQGRSYMHCAAEYEHRGGGKGRCFASKKRVHQFVGHKDGVNAISFLPRTGHLLLSASNDSSCKIWSVFGDRKCLRTFSGHGAGVRNICFSKNGSRFLSTSYDRWLKLWDTERGKVIWRGTSGVMPFGAKFYPENEMEFICGQKNKMAVQWDMRSNQIVQKYDEHLSAVNDVLFIDDHRRFVTTSDDKKMFIWDYGTPVVIKHISEPHLHSVPVLKLHPSKKWFLGQSMDNKIVTYSARGKIGRLNAKKHFEGHLCAGYAVQLDVSYDANIIISGDAQGKCYFWDWKSGRLLHKMQCHKKVTMGATWHPTKSSMIATCSWDATIALWA